MLRTNGQPRIGLLLLGLVLLAYLPALQCGFIWDDDDYVTENPVLRTAAGLWQLWTEPTSIPQYYPLVHTMFWFEYQFWGLDPLGYHLVNVVLHAISAILLWRLLERLSVPAALLAAALFAVHPVHVESVAWVTERKNVLSLMFYLLAAHAWLRWRDGGSFAVYGLTILAFLAALLSKTVTASLPAALLLLAWWKDGRLDRRDVLASLPMFVFAIGFGWLTAYLEQSHVGAVGEPWDLSSVDRVLVAGRAVWFYALELIWPFGLCFNYARWQIDSGAAWHYALPLGALLVAGIAWALRGRLGRGPLVALLLFGGTLVPALGFFDVYPFRYSFVADHFQYHASIGALVLLVSGGRWLAHRYVAANGRKILAGAVVTAAATLTFLQCFNYRDQETLWRHTLTRNPRSLLAHTNLGKILLDRTETLSDPVEREQTMQRAIGHLELCVDLHSYNYEAHINLGVARIKQDDPVSARSHFEKALEIKPDAADAQSNLAFVLLQEGDLERALELVQSALSVAGDHYGAHITAAMLFSRLQRWRDALAHADWVLRRTPEAREMRLLAAESLLQMGSLDKAVANALLLARGRPDDVEARGLLLTTLSSWLAAASPTELDGRVRLVQQRLGDAAGAVLTELERQLRAAGLVTVADAVAATMGG